MRILFVNPTKLIKRPVKELMGLLKDKDYEVRLLAPGVSYKSVNVGGGSEQPLPISPKFFRRVFDDLRWADVVHVWVPYYLTNLWIILMKRLFFPKKKLILTMDTLPGVSFSMGKLDFLFRVYNKLFGWLIFNTPDVVTLYGESLRPFALRAGVSEGKIKVLGTGVFIPIKNEGKGSVICTRYKDDEFVRVGGRVLYAGLMVKRKGIGKIMKISELLPELSFVLVGEGPEKKRYDKYYYKGIPFVARLFARVVDIGYFRHNLIHRVGSNVFFSGWSNRMRSEYDVADVFLLPSDGEGLPGVVMEAMSCGVPCVASDIPCIPDLIDSGVNGYLCDKDNIEEFAMRIKKLTDDEKKRKRFGKAAQKKMKKFDWNKVVKKYEELYADLLNRRFCYRCGGKLNFKKDFYWCSYCGKVYEGDFL